MIEPDLIQRIVLLAVPILLAVTLHEVGHGWVAYLLGDATAKEMGRLSLNPLRHIDPVGTIIVPAVMVLLTGFVFGWAKPVPIDWRRLKHPRRDMVYVALAGPGVNLLLLIISVVIMATTLKLGDPASRGVQFISYLCVSSITINSVLMILNLIPIPPLDGGRVLTGILPRHLAVKFAQIERFGLPILVLLMISGLLGRIIGIPLLLIYFISSGVMGISVEQFLGILSLLFGHQG